MEDWTPPRSVLLKARAGPWRPFQKDYRFFGPNRQETEGRSPRLLTTADAATQRSGKNDDGNRTELAHRRGLRRGNDGIRRRPLPQGGGHGRALARSGRRDRPAPALKRFGLLRVRPHPE